ncbi:hypothetical protein Nepgr_014845 [Nepenthes gracilis]|uniref:Uncharacterized protein n=1 Tax=Nepenthes gracilis TaxID=150966 RepID=A0AAD3XQJ0_NEPGR|nr:hypothetical protein Nepgr_014845 [Nepenthes gracilis]
MIGREHRKREKEKGVEEEEAKFAENAKHGLLEILGPVLSSDSTEASSSAVPTSLCLSPCWALNSHATNPGIDLKLLPSELQTASWADVVQSTEKVATLTPLNSGVVSGGFENLFDIGVHDGAEKALPKNLGSAVEHPPCMSVGIGQDSPTDAASIELIKNNQWGITPHADNAEEIRQFPVLDHVAGPLDLILNAKDSPSPPNNLLAVLQDPVDFDEQEDCVEPEGRIVMNIQPPPHASEMSLPVLNDACLTLDPEVRMHQGVQGMYYPVLPTTIAPITSSHVLVPDLTGGQQSCNVEEVSRPAKCSLTVSFVEMLQEGIDPIDSGLPSICDAPVPISDEDRLATFGSSINMMKPLFPVCVMAAMEAVSFSLPIEAESKEDPAVVSAHSPHDAQFAHHDMAPALDADLDLTPNSITRLSSGGFGRLMWKQYTHNGVCKSSPRTLLLAFAVSIAVWFLFWSGGKLVCSRSDDEKSVAADFLCVCIRAGL